MHTRRMDRERELVVVASRSHGGERLEAFIDGLAEPGARYELAESVSLAFVTACQLLPPRQLAALLLRDVLGFTAAEVAAMLDVTLDAANSALKRARAGLQRLGVGPGDSDARYRIADVDAVALWLLTAASMPAAGDAGSAGEAWAPPMSRAAANGQDGARAEVRSTEQGP